MQAGGFSFGTPFRQEALFSTSSLSGPVQSHLARVYSCVGATLLSAAAGAYASGRYGVFSSMPALPALFAFGLVMAIASTKHSKEMANARLGMLLGFGFINGVSLSPLLTVVAALDPSILVTALVSTAAIFVCFTVSALLAERRSMLYLGAILSSAMSVLMFASLINIFFRSTLVPWMHLYGGLVVFSGFILFDTQLMLELAIAGDRDYISHALNLFIDFVAVFVRILIILLKNSKEEKDDRRRRR